MADLMEYLFYVELEYAGGLQPGYLLGRLLERGKCFFAKFNTPGGRWLHSVGRLLG